MIKLETIYSDFKQNNYDIFYDNIGFASAVTISLNKSDYGIFIDKSYETKERELKEILMHEYGHCKTGTLYKFDTDKLTIERCERCADRTAIERYLPYEELCDAMKNGYREVYELAEHFEITEDFIKKALFHYTNNKGLFFDER